MSMQGQYGIPEGYKLVKDPNYQNPYDYQRAAMLRALSAPKQIPARFVNSPEEIMPNEIPADGTLALFPRSDYKVIYARQLNNRNTVDEVTYVPLQVQQPVDQNAAPQPQPQVQKPEIDFTPLNQRLENIESMLTNLKSLWDTPGEAAQK